MKTAGLLLALLGFSATSAFASDLFVNSTRDRVDAVPGDRFCNTGFTNADGSPECTLRAAVQEANWAGRGSGAWIHVPAGEFVLSLTVPSGENEEERMTLGTWDVHRSAMSGDLDLLGGVRVTGAGQALTIVNRNNIDRVFDLWPSDALQVTIEQVTIAHGLTRGTAGGCVNNRSFSNNPSVCGALHNAGIAEINESTFVGNGAETSFELGQGMGGAIANYSTHGQAARMTLINSTLMNNGAPWGAAILNWYTATIRNTTISGNMGQRGAIANLRGGRVGLTHVTLTGNVGSGVFQQPRSSATMGATASILSNNRDQLGTLLNCVDVTLSSSRYSIEDGDTCGLAGEGDRILTDPLLGPLADNLGPTLTHALLEGSPAIDAVRTRLEPRDQRDFPRLELSPSDVGAYEYGAEEFGLMVVIPIRWRDLFRGPLPTGGKYSIDGSLIQRRSLRRTSLSAQITGVKQAGQNGAQYWLGAGNRELKIQGSIAPPPPKGSKASNDDPKNPELFYLVLKQGTGLADTLRLTGSCDCSDKPARKLRVKIPRFEAPQR